MPEMTAFKGHIFDLDGTLIRSNHVWTDVDVQFLRKRGFTVPEDYSKALSTMNFDQAAVYTKERFALPDSVDEIKQEWFDLALYQYTTVIELFDGVYDYVTSLYNNGKKLALATASSHLLYEPVLKRTGVYDCFCAFVSTEEVKRGKGFPDVYERAAEKLGLMPCDCIVYEDIVEGIRAAAGAGFHTAACANGHYNEDEQILAAAEFVFRKGSPTTD